MSSIAKPHNGLGTPLYILCTYVHTWNEKTHWLITTKGNYGMYTVTQGLHYLEY